MAARRATHPTRCRTSCARPSVLANLALRPSAAACPAMRSGIYCLIAPTVVPPAARARPRARCSHSTPQFPSVTNAAGATFMLSPVVGSPCKFLTVGGGDWVVSHVGVFAIRTGDSLMSFGGLEQSIALANLAGHANILGDDRSGFTHPLGPNTFTLHIGPRVTSNRLTKPARRRCCYPFCLECGRSCSAMEMPSTAQRAAFRPSCPKSRPGRSGVTPTARSSRWLSALPGCQGWRRPARKRRALAPGWQ